MLNENDYLIIEYVFKFLKNNKEFDTLTLFLEIERLIKEYGCCYKPYYYYRYALNKLNSYYSKVSRIKKRIKSYQYPHFITLTINDSNYGLDIKTYIRTLKRCLSFAYNYVANIDFGAKNGRLHFHAIVDFPISTKVIIDWPYGFVDVKGCYSLMHKYLYKICNHALKKTASTLIYSRKKRK